MNFERETNETSFYKMLEYLPENMFQSPPHIHYYSQAQDRQACVAHTSCNFGQLVDQAARLVYFPRGEPVIALSHDRDVQLFPEKPAGLVRRSLLFYSEVHTYAARI